MRIIKQRPNECLLASLAMVCGRNYELLSNAFAASYGIDWGMCSVEQAHHWWSEFAATVLGVQLPLWAIDARFPADRECFLEAFKPDSRGVLLLRHGLSAHAVAFDGPVIYDPAKDQPYDLVDYFRIFAAMPYGALVVGKGV